MIAFMFSLLLFVLTGSAVLIALISIEYIAREILAYEFKSSWTRILSFCMAALTVVTVLLNLFAISVNIKLTQVKDK